MITFEAFQRRNHVVELSVYQHVACVLNGVHQNPLITTCFKSLPESSFTKTIFSNTFDQTDRFDLFRSPSKLHNNPFPLDTSTSDRWALISSNDQFSRNITIRSIHFHQFLWWKLILTQPASLSFYQPTLSHIAYIFKLLCSIKCDFEMNPQSTECDLLQFIISKTQTTTPKLIKKLSNHYEKTTYKRKQKNHHKTFFQDNLHKMTECSSTNIADNQSRVLLARDYHWMFTSPHWYAIRQSSTNPEGTPPTHFTKRPDFQQITT